MKELHEMSAKDLEGMNHNDLNKSVDDQLDAVKKLTEEQKKGMEHMALLAWKLFGSNPDGKEFLDGLRSRLAAPVFLVNKPEMYGHLREGENSLIRWIISLIDSHKRKTGV